MHVSIYVEVYCRRCGKKTLRCVSSEVHLEKKVLRSSQKIVESESNADTVVSEVSCILEQLCAEQKEYQTFDVTCYTSCDDMLWAWKGFEVPSLRGKDCWSTLEETSSSMSSFCVRGAGLLSRTILDRARICLNERIDDYAQCRRAIRGCHASH